MDDLLNVTVFGGVEDSDIDDAILINILNQEKNIFKRFLNYGINYLGFFSVVSEISCKISLLLHILLFGS